MYAFVLRRCDRRITHLLRTDESPASSLREDEEHACASIFPIWK
jgi:hypothetical protein